MQHALLILVGYRQALQNRASMRADRCELPACARQHALLPILRGVLSDRVEVLAMTCCGDHKTPVAAGLPSALTHTTDLAVQQPVSKLPACVPSGCRLLQLAPACSRTRVAAASSSRAALAGDVCLQVVHSTAAAPAQHSCLRCGRPRVQSWEPAWLRSQI